MILAWTLLIAVSSSPADGGLDRPEPIELRPECKPPGYWDAQSHSCRPGCGIPSRWENGVLVGGCSNGTVPPELNTPACKPPTTWNPQRKRCERAPK
jgi:hypothetical protein